jgi:hypothetical protein
MAIVFSDDFNRADGAVGNNWVTESGAHQIASNQLQATSSGVIYNPADIGSADHSVACVFDPEAGNRNEWVFCLGRMPTTGTRYDNCYIYYYQGNSGLDNNYLFKRVNGTQTAITSSINDDNPDPIKVTLRCEGNTIKGFVDDRELHSTTDTSHNIDGDHGLRLDRDSTADDYEVDDLSDAAGIAASRRTIITT